MYNILFYLKDNLIHFYVAGSIYILGWGIQTCQKLIGSNNNYSLFLKLNMWYEMQIFQTKVSLSFSCFLTAW